MHFNLKHFFFYHIIQLGIYISTYILYRFYLHNDQKKKKKVLYVIERDWTSVKKNGTGRLYNSPSRFTIYMKTDLEKTKNTKCKASQRPRGDYPSNPLFSPPL